MENETDISWCGGNSESLSHIQADHSQMALSFHAALPPEVCPLVLQSGITDVQTAVKTECTPNQTTEEFKDPAQLMRNTSLQFKRRTSECVFFFH